MSVKIDFTFVHIIENYCLSTSFKLVILLITQFGQTLGKCILLLTIEY